MKKIIILLAGVLLVLAGTYFFRENLYIFMMYRGKGEWASKKLAAMKPPNIALIEKHLQSDRWYVRCALIRTLHRMDNKEAAMPVIEDLIRKEQDGACRLELAVALLKYGQWSAAKAVLESIADHEIVGASAREYLAKLEEMSAGKPSE